MSEQQEPIIEEVKVDPDKLLTEAMAAVDNGTLTMEQKNYLRDRFMGLDKDQTNLSGQEKADMFLRAWEKSLINNMPNLEEVKKEFYDKTHSIEIDESKDRIQNTHINMKQKNMRLIIASEGGRVITINNREALEEYRTAVQNAGKINDQEKIKGGVLHNSREFS